MKKTIKATIVVITCRMHHRGRWARYTLLGLKPDGNDEDKAGQGKWTLGGGKDEPEDRSPENCARREILEEFGLQIPEGHLRRVGRIKGFKSRKFKRPKWDVVVFHIHMPRRPSLSWAAETWVDVEWFRRGEIPWKQMMKGDKKWLPGVLRNPKKKPFHQTIYLDD
jgi:8-oxo-dGTP pyrophosphatase MutT (NUDIX family)